MRKVLSFVLVLAMILGSVSMAFAASPTDVVGKDSEEAVNVLMEFGVVTGYPDGSFKPAGIVTRAEMAAFVIRALGLNPNAAATTQFADVPASHWASKFVVYAASLGIIKGRTATMFDPDATVSYDEAVTMLVRALGYNDTALQGTYPAAYVSKAKALGIIGKIQAGTAGANRGDIAQLVFNTLSCTTGKVNADGIWVADKEGKTTMMARLGAVDYNPGANRVYTVGTAAADLSGAAFVVVGDEESVINLRNYQGALVTAYANSDGEIISLNEIKSVFVTEEYKSGDKSFGDYEIKDNAYPVTGVNFTDTFANGVSLSTKVTTTAITNGNTYTLGCKVSGKYITAIYSIAKWDIIQDDMLEQRDLDEIEDDKLLTEKLPLDNDKKVDYDKLALYGITNLNDLKKDDVVYVYSTKGAITRIDVGTEVIEGTITKINSGKTKITVNGTEYKISAKTSEGDGVTFETFKVKVNSEVKLYLDYAGKVYHVKVLSGDADKLAIYLNYASASALRYDAMFELFLEDGTVAKIDVDNDDLKNAAAEAFAVSGITKGAVIKYDLNSKGKLNAITIAAVTPNHVLVASASAVSAKGVYDSRYIASDAVIFTANTITPQAFTAETNTDNLGITTLDKILDTKDVASFYHYNTTTNKIDWMVINTGTSGTEVFAAYNDYAFIDPDFEVYTLVNGAAKTYVATAGGKEPIPTPGALGLLKLVFDVNGAVKGYTEVLTGGGADKDWKATSHAALTSGAVVSVVNNVVTITGSALITSVGALTLDKDVNIYKWDVLGDKEWVKGSNSDLYATKFTKPLRFYDIDGDGVYDYVFVSNDPAFI